MEIDESTFFVVDETCDERAFFVIVVYVVILDSLDTFRTHIRFYLFKIFLNETYLIRFEWCASVAGNTTFTFASMQCLITCWKRLGAQTYPRDLPAPQTVR